MVRDYEFYYNEKSLFCTLQENIDVMYSHDALLFKVNTIYTLLRKSNQRIIV